MFYPKLRCRIWQRDKDELLPLYQVLHACRREASRIEHARPPVTDGVFARAVAPLRNRRGIDTDHWTLLELKTLPDVEIANLAFIVRQIAVRLTIPLRRLTNLICLLDKPGRRRKADCAAVAAAHSVEQLPC